MKGIGGNITAVIQVKAVTKNEIGEQVESWTNVQSITGYKDLIGGDSKYSTYNAKVRESTHIFVGDYVPLDSRIKDENSRMVIKGERYDIMLIDNPMELENGSQLEIYLKFTGGQ